MPASSKFWGKQDDVGAISLVSAAEHQLRLNFPDAALEEADAAGPVTEDGRTDFRDIPAGDHRRG